MICGYTATSDAYYCKGSSFCIMKSVHCKKRIVMDVQRLLTWEAPKPTCFTKKRSMAIDREDISFTVGFECSELFGIWVEIKTIEET